MAFFRSFPINHRHRLPPVSLSGLSSPSTPIGSLLLQSPAYNEGLQFGQNSPIETGPTFWRINGMFLARRSEDAIRPFRNGTSPILVATGVMARGFHVNNITHVINYDMLMEPGAWNHHLLQQLDSGRRLTAPDSGEDRRARRPGAGPADGVGCSRPAD
ncbi:hypothetical protein HDK77DRAFT_504300 [Phyllosticta capitalensis]